MTGASHLPASYAQERLWFLDRLHPDSAVYNVPVLVRMPRRTKRSVLERCLKTLSDRHETLRTAFHGKGGAVLQWIAPSCAPSLAYVDLRRFPSHEREERLARLMAADAARAFDLSEAPLLRACLYRLGADDDRLMLVIHHIVCDAWSVEIVLRELAELHAAFESGRLPSLPSLSVQYADWAGWQRGRLDDGLLDAQLAYWRKHLGGAPHFLDLPADRPRPAVQSYRGAIAHFAVPADTAAGLHELATQSGCTPYMVLLAAFAILLGRYARQGDLVIGSPMTMRAAKEVEGLIGLFVNTLPLRADLTGCPSVRSVLGRMRQTVIDAQANAELPFERLIEALNPPRSLDRHPIFQTLFSLQAGSETRSGLYRPAPAGARPPPTTATAKFDLSLLLSETSAGLAGAWEYSTDLFDADRIERMSAHYLAILDAFTAAPDAPIDTIELLGARERELIAGFESGPALKSCSPATTIHGRVAEQARLTPEAIAVEAGETQMTYAGLIERSDRLARHLRRRGVGPESRVGLLVGRNPEMVVAALAVLRCGAAYVPLDPTHPRARLAYIADDAPLAFVVVQDDLAELVPDGVTAISAALPANAGLDPAEPEVSGEQAAYILYTSGSTGRPKGVAVPHRAVAAFLDWAAATFDATARARLLASTSLCFDLSVFELFLPLTTGGTVVVVENVLALAGADAPDVSLINTVPSAMRELARLWRPKTSLRAINLAGEALAHDLVARLAELAPRARVNNLYGPTETTIYSTGTFVAPEGKDEPSIGRPINGTVVRVLDRHFRRVPVGVPGELYIGGAGVARGYVRRPGLTAERYLPDPFAAEPGARMYRTGDLVRWRASGELDYLGRIDHQVKLRGHRIELGEIESVLREHPSVREAVVMLREVSAGDPRLVAYVATEAGRRLELTAASWRALPDYMIPKHIVFVDGFLRTATGKIDRGALPAPELGPQAAPRAPASPREAAVTELFAAALGVATLDPDADFFASGGHSLLAARAVGQINEVLGIELPLSTLFKHPTPAALAASIDASPLVASGSIVPAPKADAGSPCPLSFMQEGMWFYERLRPGTALYHMPMFVPFASRPDEHAVQRAIDFLLARHDALRLRYDTVDREAVQVADDALRVTVTRCDFSGQGEGGRASLARAVERELRRPFDLRRGPPLRAMLATASAGEHLLVLVLHHIAGDGGSTEILLQDFKSAYDTLANGGTPELPRHPRRYTDFVRWQRAALTPEAIAGHLGYFREALSGAPSLSALPADRPRPPNPSFRGGIVPFAISSDTAARAAAVAAAQGATPQLFYLAAFALLLRQLSGRQDAVIGIPVANRGRREWRDVVGLFTNSIPIRVASADAENFAALIERVSEAAVAAYAHEELPFDRLVQHLRPSRSLDSHPIFQVMFGYQQAEGDLPGFHDVVGTGTAKFDLSVNLTLAHNGAFGIFEYAADLFDHDSILRVARQFERVVEAAAGAASSPLSAIAPLDAVTQTWCENGRANLRPAPGGEAPAAAAEGASSGAARTDLEAQIATIWEEVLGRPDFSASDNFFEIGGHSLAAMIVATRISEIGFELPFEVIFANPTIAALARAIDAARGQAPAEAGEARELATVNRSGPLPLSFAQERLWFLDQLDPGLPVYNIPVVMRLRQDVDRLALQRALERLVERHETLRSRFPAGGDGPGQCIEPSLAITLDYTDLGTSPPGKRATEAARLQGRVLRRPFELEQGPLLRAHLLRLGPQDCALLLCVHHIVADARSIDILNRDLIALYEAECTGVPERLPVLTAQYLEFAAWQRQRLSGKRLADETAYWRARLDGAPQLLALPTDHKRPKQQNYEGRQLPFGLDTGTSDAVRRLAREEQATSFMVLLAAYAAMLGRWADANDVVVGTPVIGRPRREFEELIGFFSNTLPIRLRLPATENFRTLVRQTRDAVVEGLTHQDLPFESMVQDLQPQRSLAHNPLFQAMFAFQLPGEAATDDGAAPSRDNDTTPELWGTSKFDLTLFLIEGERFHGALEFRTDLFDAETIRRFGAHLRRFVAAASASPDLPLPDLSVADSDDRAAIEGWNRTGAAFADSEIALDTLVGRRAAIEPATAAVSHGDASLSYGELWSRATSIASRLRALGVQADSRVAVAAEPSIELVATVLGIWLANGACVPLDPAYPRERLDYMVANSRAGWLVGAPTDRALAPDLPFVDWGDPGATSETFETIQGARAADQLAYVVYTSGSTGRPKGVAMTHRALANLIAWQSAGARGAPRRTLQFASPSFDVFFQEVALTLVTGGELVIAGREQRRDPALLIALCRHRAVERLFLPYVVLRELAEAGAAADPLPRLREVITAGERLLVTQAIRSWFAAHPAACLLNQYGPSESHVVTEERLAGDPKTWPDLPPIGSVIANVHCHVLDEMLRPLPIGAPGELYLGGVALARGYLDRPGLTAERFLPDPFADVGGARLYKTGDRAKWLADGRIAYLGRADEQVKIRGWRVEPAEIEIALAALPGVRQAVVLPTAGEDGALRLTGYVLLEQAGQDTGSLRQALRARLPEPLVPAQIIAVEKFARTPSGKIDRRALPSAPRGSPPADEPVDGLAGTVAQVWREVLAIERVGSEDDFFALGGHSLSAAQVAARLRKQLAIDCPVRLLFEHPTVATLVAALASGPGGARTADEGAPQPVPRDGAPLPASFAQHRMWFIDQLEPGGTAYNLTSVINFPDDLDREALRSALNALVRRHEALRTIFRTVGGEPVQLIRPPARVEIDMLDLSFAPTSEMQAELGAVVADALEKPFDLDAGPLFRATLADFGSTGAALVLAMHHIISDAWSLKVIERDLRALYDAAAEGRRAALAPLAVQYADFAAWQRQHLAGPELERLLAYWRGRIGGAPQQLQLAAGRGHGSAAARQGGRCTLSLDPELTRRLLSFAGEQHVTLFMLMLAIYFALLRAYSEQDDFLVGVPVGARDDVVLEDVVGLFVNTLVMRAEFSGDPGFRELLRRVHREAVGAYAHAALPFERLVEALQPRREAGVNPLVQVAFGLHHDDRGALIDAESAATSTGNGTAKFDLSLVLFEQDGRITGLFEYRRDLLSDELVGGMARHFERLARLAVTEFDVPLSQWRLLDAGEERVLTEQWGCGESVDATSDLAALVARHAARHPGKAAIEAPDGTLDYLALETRSNRLAQALHQALGHGELRVGVCLPNTSYHPLALLAILKAGAAYVPLDPALPAARLCQLASASGLRLIVTDRAGAERLQPAAIETWRVEELDYRPLDRPPPVETHPDQLAYVIYTSGSTGKPKGVMTSRTGLRILIAAQLRVLALSPADRVLKFATPSFDAAIFEIVMALAAGATLCMAREDELLPGPELPLLLRDRAITVAVLTPSSLAVLPLEPCPALRLLFAAGEACPAELVRNWERGRRMINGYGPTETSVWVSYADCRADGLNPPIGGPVPNATLRIVDRNLRLVAPGLPGEICVAGPVLARGYLDRPGLTAQAFVPDPHGAPGSRMYRTGDLARWRGDGEIEYLGRIDAQIKIRGMRIEPGEIEAAIMAEPGVAYAIVIVREDRPGERRLVAYAVAEQGAKLEPDRILGALRRQLPRNMVPSHIMVCVDLPRTPSGKLDRAALPAPALEPREAKSVQPSSVTEAICAVCADILKVPAGPADNFFALGGHSLLLTRLVSRLHQDLGIDVSVRRMFDVETLSEFCDGLTLDTERAWTIPRLARTPFDGDNARDGYHAASAAEIV
jgi:amino acid adenylation domain-containing protein